jgi:hypothetical protein
VVSVVPNFNRALFQASQKAVRHSVRYDSDGFCRLSAAFLAGEAGAVRDLRYGAGVRAGVAYRDSKEKAFLVSGMILRPAFYRPMAHDAQRSGENSGWTRIGNGHRHVRRPSAGRDAHDYLRSAKSYAAAALIVVCGRNAGWHRRSAPSRNAFRCTWSSSRRTSRIT